MPPKRNRKNQQSSDHRQTRPWMISLILIGGPVGLFFSMILSITIGSADLSFFSVWESFVQFDASQSAHQIVHEVRLPRALGGALIGASFAVAGALMQGMTRNPLADPGLLGLNAGASFALVICMAFFPHLPFLLLVFYAFIGAGIGAILVYGISSLSKRGVTPVRLVLAGAAVSALLSALSEGIALYFQLSQELTFWFAGGVVGTTWLQIEIMMPIVILAIFTAIILSRSITVLSLGEELAAGLGQRIWMVKLASTIIVLLLAGSAVAVVGPIGFIGLVIPHIVKLLVGADYRWIIPCSAILGSLFVILADIGARIIHPPYEVPVGVVIAVIGVPVLLYLIRQEGVR